MSEGRHVSEVRHADSLLRLAGLITTGLITTKQTGEEFFSPHVWSSRQLEYIHPWRFMCFFRNRNCLTTDYYCSNNLPSYDGKKSSLLTVSVSDQIVSFTPTPTPSSHSSLSHSHRIHTPTLPSSTILTITYTQVLWFLPESDKVSFLLCEDV